MCNHPYFAACIAVAAAGIIMLSACRKDIHAISTTQNLHSLQQTRYTKPNIILIYADDIGFEIPAYSGGLSYETPNIDNLSAIGMQFSQCRALPVCSPSRTELMTGKYNFRNYFAWGSLGMQERTFVNDLADAGYQTCLAGKWDLGGGDSSIRSHGFGSYMATIPFNNMSISEPAVYKNPSLYVNGSFLADSLTVNQYGQDMLADFMFDFIDSNANHPFFVYWSPNLCHKPFSPTPDDAAYPNWDPLLPPRPGDSIYFPSMVKYMDKLIGALVAKLKSSGLNNNTVIVFASDNGTPGDITSRWKNETIKGGKGSTKETGIHVPLLVYWKGHTVPGAICSDLVDICDIYPTLTMLAGISAQPAIDGISFAPQVYNVAGEKRRWSFGHFQPRPEILGYRDAVRWVTDGKYKRYDSVINPLSSGFFNTAKDYQELYPLAYETMTAYERKVNDRFIKVLGTMQQ